MKQFTIKFNGADSVIEVNDEPTADVMAKIRRNARKQTVGGNNDIDIDEYIIGLATNLITKAPWGTVTHPDTINKLPYKVRDELAQKLGDEFPIRDFLYTQAKVIYGTQLEKVESLSTTDSTTNAGSEGSPKSA